MIKVVRSQIIFNSSTIGGLALMFIGIFLNNIPISIFGLAMYLTED